jgi:hypothetical protein
MKNAIHSVIIAIILFFLNILLTAVVAHFSSEKGYITQVNPISIGGMTYSNYYISNHSDGFINGLIISTPLSVKKTDFVSNSQIQISEMQSIEGANKKDWKIDRIPPQKNSSLLIFSSDASKVNEFEFPNAGDVGISSIKTKPVSPYSDAIFGTLVNATLMALFIGIIVYFDKVAADKKEAALDTIKERVANLEKSVKDSEIRALKIKALLHARISDYAKELSMWRMAATKTIRDKDANGKFIEEISRTLKTQSTLSRNNDISFDYIKIVGRLISDDHESK